MTMIKYMMDYKKDYILMRLNDKKRFVLAGRGTLEHLKSKIKFDEYYRLLQGGHTIRVEAIGGVQAFIKNGGW